MIAFGKNDAIQGYAPFLIKTEEGEDNCVKFTVALAQCGEKRTVDTTNNEALTDILSDCYPLSPDYDEVYEITFEGYILHQTRNESYCLWDDYEVREGKYFIEFARSRLLTVLPQMIDSDLMDVLTSPNKVKHYGIYCENHIIDIISCYAPTIIKLNNIGGTK